MSGQLTRLMTLAENGKKKNENGSIPHKLLFWILTGFVAVLSAIVGVNIPVG